MRFNFFTYEGEQTFIVAFRVRGNLDMFLFHFCFFKLNGRD